MSRMLKQIIMYIIQFAVCFLIALPADCAEPVLQFGHSNAISCLSYDTRGSMIATGSYDRIVKLWDVASRSLLRSLHGATGPINSVAIHPNSMFILAGCRDQSVHVWDLAQNYKTTIETGLADSLILSRRRGEAPETSQSQFTYRTPVAFSPDGKLIAYCTPFGINPNVILRSAVTLQILKIIPHQSAHSIAFSPDGSLLACGSSMDLSVNIWDIETAVKLHALKLPPPFLVNTGQSLAELLKSSRVSVAFAPQDNSRIFAFTPLDNKIVEFDISSRLDRSKTLLECEEFIESMAFGRNSPYYIVTESTNISVRNIANGEQEHSMPKDRGSPVVTGIDPNGRSAVIAVNSSIKFYELPFLRAIGEIIGLKGMSIITLYQLNKRRIAVKGFNRGQMAVGVWEPATGSLAWSKRFSIHQEFVDHLAPMPDGDLAVITHRDEALGVYHMDGGFNTVGLELQWRSPIAVKPDGSELAVLESDSLIGFYRLDSGAKTRKITNRFTFNKERQEVLSYSSDGQYFAATCADSIIRLWSLTHAVPPMRTPKFQEEIRRIELRNDILFIETHDKLFDSLHGIRIGGAMYSWNIESGILDSVSEGTRYLTINAEGAKLAASGVNIDTLMVCDVRTLRSVLKTGFAERGSALLLISKSDETTFIVRDAKFSPDDRLLAVTRNNGDVHVWDLEQARTSPIFESYPQCRIDTGQSATVLSGHSTAVSALAFAPDGKTLYSGDDNGVIKVWNIAEDTVTERASLIWINAEDYIITTPDGYYTMSRDQLEGLAFRVGDRAYPAYQFDTYYNRPDIVLERLGLASDTLIGLRRQAVKQRLGLCDTCHIDAIEIPDFASAPSITILNRDSLAATEDSVIVLHIEAADEHRSLQRLHVEVNGVPIHAARSLSIDTKNWRGPVPVVLCDSVNTLQVSAFNADNVESLRERIKITKRGPRRQRNLYLLAVGVSKYRDSLINDLQYAAIDADSIAAAFKKLEGGLYDNVYVCKLRDDEAFADSILAVKKLFKASGVMDQVIVFVSGHGMRDRRTGNWYFGAYNIRSDRPKSGGLSYNQLAGIFDGVPARERLMMIDACYAGEASASGRRAELSAAGNNESPNKGADGNKSMVHLPPVIRNRDQVSLLQEDLFANLAAGAGAVVIAASRGEQTAKESPTWGNGAFTRAVLDGLGFGAQHTADTDQDGQIRISELREFVREFVRKLTNNTQTPTMRRENPVHDFQVY